MNASALPHRDHMERAFHGAIAAARALIGVVQRRGFLPLHDFKAEQVKVARGNAPSTARAMRGIDDR
jgi:hypothetical protein